MVTSNLTSMMTKIVTKGGLMRTTVTVDDALMSEAQRLAPAAKTSELFSIGLKAFIRQEKAKRLAALGGAIPDFVTPPRNR
jgi:Arc/MetJ family transcription regulator